ncbi:MAG: cell surface protein, partial [Bacteroidota bacterium]
ATPTSGTNLFIAGTGNVGIGTTNPTEKLFVAGNIRLNDDSDIFGLDILQGFNDLRFAATPTSGTNLFIASTGNVGIGTTNPTEKLDVNGNIRAANIRASNVNVKLGSFPDYVFADNYDLMPLEELEAYIDANKHLPEMPTEAEVLENGADLGQLNTLLVEKIEELTLHLISLKKEIEQLKNQK